MHRIHLVLLSSVFAPIIASARGTAQTDNTFQGSPGSSWFVASNWSQNLVPTRAHRAVIPAGAAAVIDSLTLIDVAAIHVDHQASLMVLNSLSSFSIETDRIEVHGSFTVGSSTQPYLGSGDILLTHRTLPVGGVVGEAKQFMVHGGGVLRLFGNPRRRPWTRLADLVTARFQPLPGSTTLEVDGVNLGWVANEVVAVSTTDFDLDESETVTVSSTLQSGGTTKLTLAAPGLSVPHFSRREPTAIGQSIDMRAAVAPLDRDLVIRGDTTDTERWGGDLMIDGPLAIVEVSHVEFERMGKYGRLARYPMHFHVCGDMPSSFVKGCCFHHCFHRALSIHQTNRVLVQGNVAFEIFGHAYFLEDGNETGNQFIGNLGMNIRTPEPDPAITPYKLLGSVIGSASLLVKAWPYASTESGPFKFFRYHDQNPAVFWISNYANEFVGNVALGSDAYGFSFDMSVRDFDENGTDFRDRTLSGLGNQRVEAVGVGTKHFRFENNTAGGCGRVGFFADEEGTGRARPVLVNAAGVATSHYTTHFDGSTAFKCRMAGIWYRQYGEAIWRDCRLSDNALGVYLASEGWTEDDQYWEIENPSPSSPFHQVSNWPSIGAPVMSHQRLENSVIVGDSSNTGRPRNHDWDATLGRSLPFHRTGQPQYPPQVISAPIDHTIEHSQRHSTTWIRGVTIYDGLFGVVDTHFENFNTLPVAGGARRAAAFTISGVGDVHYVHGRFEDPWRVDPRNYTSGITFANVSDDDKIVWPPPRPPIKDPTMLPFTVPVAPVLGWAFGGGLNEVLIHDLDGSLTAYGAGYVFNANSPLLTGNAVTEIIDSNGFHVLSHMTEGNQVGALQIEIPWDWVNLTTNVTSNFTNLVIGRTIPATGTINLFDMEAFFCGSDEGFALRQRHQGTGNSSGWSSKRRFGTNVSLSTPTGAPPEYMVLPDNIVTLPGVQAPLPSEIVVRLRFGPAGGALILAWASQILPTPTFVATAAAPQLPPGGAQVNSGETHYSPSGPGAMLYTTVTSHPPAASRAALDTMTGNGWFQAGGILFLRLEMPARPTLPGADPVYSGAESILRVVF